MNKQMIEVIRMCDKLNLRVDMISSRDGSIRSDGKIYTFDELSKKLYQSSRLHPKFKHYYCSRRKMLSRGLPSGVMEIIEDIFTLGEGVVYEKTDVVTLKDILRNLGLREDLWADVREQFILIELLKKSILNIKYNRDVNDFREFNDKQKILMLMESKTRSTIKVQTSKNTLLEYLFRLTDKQFPNTMCKDEILNTMYQEKKKISELYGYCVLGG